MIELKNINLNNVSLNEQYEKSKEEIHEFRKALIENVLNNNEKTKEHVIEEYWDLVQSNLGILQKHGITADEVMEYYPNHLEKLKHRPR